jgi:hypothetical protein
MHALVISGAIAARKDFGSDSAPSLAANKGAWLPITARGNQPDYNPDTEACEPSETIGETTVTEGWTVRNLTSDELTARKIAIAREAERRIAAGKLLNGVQFRTDDATMTRLRGLLDAFDANIVPEGGVTYRTASGQTVTYSSRAVVQTLYDAANLYRSAVLETSAALQGVNPADFTDDQYWPAVG